MKLSYETKENLWIYGPILLVLVILLTALIVVIYEQGATFEYYCDDDSEPESFIGVCKSGYGSKSCTQYKCTEGGHEYIAHRRPI